MRGKGIYIIISPLPMENTSSQPAAAVFDRILIIKPGAVGDLLQMTPVVRALGRTYPDARITVLVGHASSVGLLRHHPQVAEVLLFDRQVAHRSLAARLSFLRGLRRRGFDLVLNFQRSNLLTWLFIAAVLPRRVLVYHKSRDRAVHAVENYLETLAPLGIRELDHSLEFHPGEEAERTAGELFRKHGLDRGPVVALNPGATHAVNRWPVERFAELADLLQERRAARAVIVGGPDDVRLAELIREHSRTHPLSLAGATSLPELGAVLRRSSLLVSGDTGPLHMATAVGRPVVALFGAADPGRTGPAGSGHRVLRAAGLPCVPCRSRQCKHTVPLECMWRITADQVFQEVSDLLASRSRI